MTKKGYADYLYWLYQKYKETAEQYEFPTLLFYDVIIERKRKECSDDEFIYEMMELLESLGIKYDDYDNTGVQGEDYPYH